MTNIEINVYIRQGVGVPRAELKVSRMSLFGKFTEMSILSCQSDWGTNTGCLASFSHGYNSVNEAN